MLIKRRYINLSLTVLRHQPFFNNNPIPTDGASTNVQLHRKSDLDLDTAHTTAYESVEMKSELTN